MSYKAGKSNGRGSLSSRFFDSESPNPPGAGNAKTGGQRIELILVKVAHRPFGVLLSQIYNIVRPQNGTLQVLSQPDPANNRAWGEIIYQGEPLRVLELTRMLQLPLVEPIDRSRILLSGKLRPDGTIDQPFGLAVDDILAVQAVSLDEVRLLPTWLCHKRLGRLVWAAALLDQTVLLQQSTARELQSQSVLSPLQLSDFMSEPMIFGEEANFDLQSLLPLSPTEPAVTLTNRLSDNFPVTSKPLAQSVRPVMLLDVSLLKSFAYSDQARQ